MTPRGRQCRRPAVRGDVRCQAHIEKEQRKQGLDVPASPGRKTTLTPEVEQEICENIRLGMGVDESVVLAGVPTSTYYNWKQRGEAGKRPYASFLDALKKAELEGERVLVSYMHKARRGETPPNAIWQAGAWLLERRYRERWSRQVQLEQKVEVKPGQDVCAAYQAVAASGGAAAVLEAEDAELEGEGDGEDEP